MSWGKIKKALNSTIGTDDFKPLDEIFEQGIEQFKGDLSNGAFNVGKSNILSNDWYDVEIDQNTLSLGENTWCSFNDLPNGLYAVIIYFSYRDINNYLPTNAKITSLFSLPREYEGETISYNGVHFKMDSGGLTFSVDDDAKVPFPENFRGVRIERMIVKKICEV